jgi:hypothetical protein
MNTLFICLRSHEHDVHVTTLVLNHFHDQSSICMLLLEIGLETLNVLIEAVLLLRSREMMVASRFGSCLYSGRKGEAMGKAIML